MANWIRVEPHEGTGDKNDILVSVDRYDGRISRVYNIVGKTIDGLYSDVCTVTQNGRPEFIELSGLLDINKGYIKNIGNEGGKIEIVGESNCSAINLINITPETALTDINRILNINGTPVENDWNGIDIGAIPGDPGQSNKYNFKLDLTIGKNNSYNVITRSFTLSGPDKESSINKVNISIIQSGQPVNKFISIDGDRLNYSAISGGETIVITGTSNLENIRVVSNNNIITGVTYKLSIITSDENEDVLIDNWDGTDNITIPGKYLIDKLNGYNFKISVTVPANTDINERKHQFYLRDIANDLSTGSIPSTGLITITQAAAEAPVTPSTILTVNEEDLHREISYTNTTVHIAGKSNAEKLSISAQSSNNIIDVIYKLYIEKNSMYEYISTWNGTTNIIIPGDYIVDKKNLYNFKIDVIVPENPSAIGRNHIFTISADEGKVISKEITIDQDAYISDYLNVDKTEINFSAIGGTETINVSSNIDWIASIKDNN